MHAGKPSLATVFWRCAALLFLLAAWAPSPVSARRIDAGYAHSCMVTPAGTVRCWGDNTYNELGDATLVSSTSPVEVTGLDGVVEVATGSYFSCALLGTGDVKCWGYNGNGEVSSSPAIEIPQPTLIQGLGEGVRAIAAGFDHVCALTAAGGVRCWGSNDFGQLGSAGAASFAVPMAVVGLESGVSAIAAGLDSTCALTTMGGVKCWGRNESGAMGDGTTTNRFAPVDVKGLSSGATAIAVGYGDACAVMASGKLKCWGGDGAGELGNGVPMDSSHVPIDVTVVKSRVRAVAAGFGFTCAVTITGVRCWGMGGNGQLGNGWTANVATGVDVIGLGADVVEIATLNSHVCALRSDGEVRCWGDDRTGQLGNGMPYERRSPATVAAMVDGLASIASGFEHTCAVRQDSAVECWGNNLQGQLGNGSRLSSPWPVNVLGVSTDIASVAVGNGHTCAASVDGRAFCWGWNGLGQLGDGSSTNRSTPVAVANLVRGEVVDLTVGAAHSCILTRSGGVKCWGDNLLGQLGDGSSQQVHPLPSSVVSLETDVVSVAAGSYHTCAVTAEGDVKCWGQNAYGCLGDGTHTNHPLPTSVASLGGEALAVSAYEMHTCALLRDGRVSCWGNDQMVPQFVDGVAGATAIAAGAAHACALLESGQVECWGSNWSGQLGDGSNVPRDWPVVVDIGAPAVSISAGSQYTCAVRVDGVAQCWGGNAVGQLGNGEAGYSTAPVIVAGTFPGEVLRGGHARHTRPSFTPGTPANPHRNLR